MDFEHSLLFCCEEFTNSPVSSDLADALPLTSASPSSSCSFVSFPAYSAMPALSSSEDDLTIAYLLSKQQEYMPDDLYARNLRSNPTLSEARSNAALWMAKAHFIHKFSPVTVAMAMNYLDRYLQKSSTLTWKSWMMELLSVSCLSVAAKMEEVDVPAPFDLQMEGLEYLFHAKTLQRMELNVLSAIRWRLRCVTPFSFAEKAIDHFDIDQQLKSALAMRVSELLLSTLTEVDFVSIEPSVLASASLCFALEELLPLQSKELKLLLREYIPVDEGKQRRCHRLVETLIVDPANPSMSSRGFTKSPRSPTSVLPHYDDISCVENSREHRFMLSAEWPDSQNERSSNPKRQRRG